ncbi:MAG: sigma-54-dependent Fis family transcriptional regulator [Candidatus Brocadiae bacterium]|nr:sigma-54-dependent Fis family transcriptional regulator [Candidatus Brocadiia bacterium]
MTLRDELRYLLADDLSPFERITGMLSLFGKLPGCRRHRLHVASSFDAPQFSPARAEWERANVADQVLRTGRETLAQGVRAVPLARGGQVVASLLIDGEAPLPEEAGLLLRLLAVEIDATGHASGSRAAAELVWRSPAMRALVGQIRRVALRRCPVLIVGEPGTGKELVAWLLHQWSRRWQGRFVRRSAASITDTLAEAAVHGHVEGAYTGATGHEEGMFRLAHGGTLFLDEIARAERNLQGNLLRVLSAREVTEVGGRREIPVDVRLIAATNVNLEDLVAAGVFQRDLLDRLTEERLVIPPLRERREDVEPLVRRFLGGFAPSEWPPEVDEILARQSWPGNIRELAQVCGHILVHGDGVLCARTLEAALSARRARLETAGREDPGSDRLLKDILAETERTLISERLGRFGGSTLKAAQSLGIPDRTLRHKLSRRRRQSRGPG